MFDSASGFILGLNVNFRLKSTSLRKKQVRIYNYTPLFFRYIYKSLTGSWSNNTGKYL